MTMQTTLAMLCILYYSFLPSSAANNDSDTDTNPFKRPEFTTCTPAHDTVLETLFAVKVLDTCKWEYVREVKQANHNLYNPTIASVKRKKFV